MKKSTREKHSLRATNKITAGGSKWGLKKFARGNFRSKYEHALAVYLDELKIKYEFEKHGEAVENITDTTLHYIPDFYLPDYGLYIEVVTNMQRRLAHKMNWYKTQNKYGRKLIVFDISHLRKMFDSKFTIYDVIGKPKDKKNEKAALKEANKGLRNQK